MLARRLASEGLGGRSRYWPVHRLGWLVNEVADCRVLGVVWLETGASNDPHQDCPTAARLWLCDGEGVMVFTIGIDPHKATHTAAVLDGSESVVAELRFAADDHQRDHLLLFAARFAPRTWAIEQASGLGALLAQQLVAVGETVLDVPPTLSARVRLLDSTRTDKPDSHDARAAAIVALRHPRLRPVTVVDHSAVMRLLADRHHDPGRAADPGGVSAARPVVSAHRRRRPRTALGPTGRRDAAARLST